MSADTTSAKSATSFTEDEQHVGGNALNFFKASQYEASLGILKKLQKSHSNDVRLMHNRALTEFCKSGKTKVSEFKKSLIKIQKQLQQSSQEDEDYMVISEKNNFVTLYYNHALLLYYLHQFREAEAILEKLQNNLDSSEEALFLKICLLLIDTYLHTHNAEKASNVISVVEKVFVVNDENSKKANNHEDKAKNTPVLTTTEMESLQAHLCYLKTRCLLQLKATKACKREMKSLSNVSVSPGSGTQTGVVNVASVFLKSNFEYVRCNYHKAHKLLGGSLSPSSNTVSPGMQEGLGPMYYNNIAVIYFTMGKYNIGSFYMQKALHENDSAVNVATKQHYSNLSSPGNRHQQLPTGKPLHVLNINRRFELLYNCGLQYLYCGNASVAFECLLASVHAFHSNPRLWLRLAECCIQKCTACASVDGNSKNSNKKSTSQNHPAFSVVGSGAHRKVIVNSFSQSPGVWKCNNAVMPAPTLEFASVCLSNALTILKVGMKGTNEENKVQNETKRNNGNKSCPSGPTIACLPGAPVSGSQFTHLYASVLVNSSFVALHLGNNVIALQHALALLALPKISGCHRYLGHMYAAEALVSLDRISEAIDHLSTEKINSISVELDDNGKKSPVSDDGSIKSSQSSSDTNQSQVFSRDGSVVPYWQFPTSLSSAHGYMLLNLANAHCLRSENEKALGLIKQANSLVTAKHAPTQALGLAVYLNLLNGGNGIAVALQMLLHKTLVLSSEQHTLSSHFSNAVSSWQVPATNSFSSNSLGTSGDSSSSSTSGSAPRSKSNTPQPIGGGVTPERVVKAKGSESKKRSRR